MNTKILIFVLIFVLSSVVILSLNNDGTTNKQTEYVTDEYVNNVVELSSDTDSEILTTQEVLDIVEDDLLIDSTSGLQNYEIIFSDSEINCDDSITIEDNTVYITKSGNYILSGESDEARIIVSSSETVNLILNGVELSSSNGPVILIENAKKTIITISEDTKNTLNNITSFSDSNESYNSAIYSCDDLYFTGKGELNINSQYTNGIQSKDQIIILDGTITIDSGKDAIKAKDYVVIEDGTIEISSDENGIMATKEEDYEKGFVVINGGKITINSLLDGIDAETYVIINDGNINIKTTKTISNYNTESAKGIKANSYIQINGGEIIIDSTDDAIHSDNSVIIQDGTITINANDDGIHADNSIIINGGNIEIQDSYEGIESKNIYINDGNIRIYASDDGINLADGSSSMNMMSVIDGMIEINGGYIYIECEGDGLDSNGNFYMNSGTVVVNGPIMNNNGGIDVNGECIVNGGNLIVASSLGMAESPDTSSTQNSVMIGFGSSITSGTIIHIESENGEEIITFSPTKTFQSLVVSSDKLQTGETYIVYVGGSSTGSQIDGVYQDGEYSDGIEYASFTISSAKTSVGYVSTMSSPQMRTNPRMMR